jgi:predicted phage gp36 major capsid-like protein
MPDPKKKGSKKNTSYERNNLSNKTIDRLRRLEPESSFNTEDAIDRARTNARFTTGIAANDTVNVTGYTKSGEEYKMFSKKGSPNDRQQQQMGGISNAFRPGGGYNTPEEDPYYVGNYNYKKPQNKNSKKTK